MKRFAFNVALGLAAAWSLAAGAQANEQRVGVTSAVNPQASGARPGAAARQLVVGADIIFRERVITTDEGQAQLLFLDQSSLMIGPNSQVVIDEFVYDPSTSKGNIVATLTQGSFRYIGGKLSKQGNATLKTPIATIGIRGTDVTVTYDPPKTEMQVITTNGTADIQTLGGVLALRTGFGATVNALEKPPGPAMALTAAQIAAINAMFEGKPGKSAGASNPPTDEDVANSELGSTIEVKGLSMLEPAAGIDVQRGAQNQGQQLLPPVMPPPSPWDTGTPAAGKPLINVGNSGGPGTNPPPIDPPPGPRTDQTLNGYVAGFSYRTTEQTTYSDILANGDPTAVEIRTIPDPEGSGRVLAKFSFRSVDPEGFGSASLEMGDPPGSGEATKSGFVDDSTFYAAQNSTVGEGKAKINGYNAAANAVMVSIPASNHFGNSIEGIPTGALCNCEYVKWGLWAAVLDQAEGDAVIVPTGLWVAGKLPSIHDPSPQGSATFSGKAIGIVENAQLGSSGFKTGDFTNVYNFSQRTGNVTISNFDGKTFSGGVSAGSDWRNYSGSLAGPGLTGSVNGSFYGNRNAAGQLQVPKETAGNFHVTGSGYTASGIFAGNR